MKNIGKVYLVFLLKLSIAFWLFSFCRLLFYLFNIHSFPEAEFRNFLGGIRFDWMTIIILYSPYFLAYLFLPSKNSKLLSFLFLLSSAIGIIFNFIDFEYFKYTSKRTSWDLFSTSGLGGDLSNLLPSFLRDFWYYLIIGIILFLTVRWLYKKVDTIDRIKLNWKPYSLFAFLLIAFYSIGFRGGLQYKPLSVIQASQYAQAQNISLVLNTPFTLIKSAFKEDMIIKEFYTPEELESIYTPRQQIRSDSTPTNLNVIIIILESFSKEYIGGLNDYEGYTPFLDSLIKESLSFTNAFANGKKSIEGLPSILSGIPTLMDQAYISSKYSANNIQSLPLLLKEKDYKTAFYHGGENGTMGFQAFTQIAGIDRYIGKDEYPYEGDYDGNWGIFDEPFLQFCIEDINMTKEPFFAGIFTLSSHHPYTIPIEHKSKFIEGPIPILKSITYADYALRKFFEKARQQNWFNNTLFVLTADHTQHNFQPSYNNSVGNYRIPLLFYSPKHLAPRIDSSIAQQNDICSSVIDFLGFETDLLNFGNSVFDTSTNHFSINYLNNVYQLIKDDYCLQFDGEKAIALYYIKTDPELKDNLLSIKQTKSQELEKFIKGIIQQYQSRIHSNQLLPS